MDISDTKTKLLRASEKLFALHGIDAVSLRTISSEIGQKNKTAAQYHFGSKEGLIKAIFLDRMTVVNLKRQHLLDQLLAAGEPSLSDLVKVLLEPFVELLLDEQGGRYYVRFTAQLFSQGQMLALFNEPEIISKTQQQLFTQIKNKLASLPTTVVSQRLMLMVGLLTQATAAKDFELENVNPKQRGRVINKFSQELASFIVGGLTAPVDDTA